MSAKGLHLGQEHSTLPHGAHARSTGEVVDTRSPADRTAIRAFVASNGAKLELAQAQGVLARTKLDLKDSALAAFPGVGPDELPRFERTLDEEIDAFCADHRLAAITVQAQVERTTRMNVALALFLSALCALAVAFVGLLFCASTTTVPFGVFLILLGAPLTLIFSFIGFRKERTTASIA